MGRQESLEGAAISVITILCAVITGIASRPEFKRAVFTATSFARRHSWGLGGTAGIKRVVPHCTENEEWAPKTHLRSVGGVVITSMLRCFQEHLFFPKRGQSCACLPQKGVKEILSENQKNVFIVWLAEHQSRLSAEDLRSPPLEIISILF